MKTEFVQCFVLFVQTCIVLLRYQCYSRSNDITCSWLIRALVANRSDEWPNPGRDRLVNNHQTPAFIIWCCIGGGCRVVISHTSLKTWNSRVPAGTARFPSFYNIDNRVETLSLQRSLKYLYFASFVDTALQQREFTFAIYLKSFCAWRLHICSQLYNPSSELGLSMLTYMALKLVTQPSVGMRNPLRQTRIMI